MKSLVVKQARDLEIQDIPEPQATDDTVIVKNKISVILREHVGQWNGTDPRVRSENKENPLYRGYPYTLSGELVGEVVQVGAKVANVGVGDRLAGSGQHNDLLRLDPRRYIKLSANVPSDLGISLLWGATTLHVVRRAQIVLGDNVVVVGQGPLGLQVTRWVSLAGAGQVIAVERIPQRLAFSEQFGATSVINPDKTDAHKAVLDLTEGRGADVVINATTAAPAFEFCLRLARKKGRVAVLSWHTQPITIHDLTHDFYTKELDIIGSEAAGPPDELQSPYVRWTRSESMRYVERMMAAGKFDTRPLITHRFPPERVVEALRLVEEQPEKVLKAVLEW